MAGAPAAPEATQRALELPQAAAQTAVRETASWALAPDSRPAASSAPAAVQIDRGNSRRY
jgi:hypothetical protein